MKTITVDKTSPDLYYGILYRGTEKNKSKGFLSRPEYLSGPYVWSCCCGVQEGNHFADKKTDLQSAIQSALKNGADVFEFPNHKSLFKWLSY